VQYAYALGRSSIEVRVPPLLGIMSRLRNRRSLHRLHHPRIRIPTHASKAGHSRGHIFRRPTHLLDCLNARTPLAPGSRSHGSAYASGHRSPPSVASSARTSSVESTGTWSLDSCTSRRMCREMGRQTACPKPHRVEVRLSPVAAQLSLTP
jgi:hypothetical protein